MFPEDDRQFSFLGWAFQSVLVFFGTMAGLFVIGVCVEAADTPVWQAIDYLVVLVPGIALALAVSRLAPTSAIEGVWVWVVPVGLVALIVASDLFWYHHGEAALMFYFGRAGGESALGFMLITMPGWGCCCYSAAMWWRRRRRLSQR
jgi:hypothetical protein